MQVYIKIYGLICSFLRNLSLTLRTQTCLLRNNANEGKDISYDIATLSALDKLWSLIFARELEEDTIARLFFKIYLTPEKEVVKVKVMTLNG